MNMFSPFPRESYKKKLFSFFPGDMAVGTFFAGHRVYSYLFNSPPTTVPVFFFVKKYFVDIITEQ